MPSPQTHIRTHTGKELNLFELKPEDVDIYDIAHSLSYINRFNGHTLFPINVAAHSICVALLCDGAPCSRQGLLHDATEAYIGDVTKWLKHTREMEAFRDLEAKIWLTICERFNINPILDIRVERADKLLVYAEGIMGFGEDFKIDHPAYERPTREEIIDTVRFSSSDPVWCKRRFLDYFKQFS